MSERANITVDEIRKGDLIRLERPGGVPGEGTGMVAVEYIACRDGDCYREPGGRVSYYLLDRAVVLPTAPYSLVVPPNGKRHVSPPFILDVTSRMGDVGWSQAGVFKAHKIVAGAVKNEGWLIIAAEEITEDTE